MLIETKKGTYKVNSNYRDAFRLDIFEEKYIEECFDKYIYIVGDISSGILRLKGFDTNPKSKNYFGFIDDYLNDSCAPGCPYYILKRIQSDNEYQKELSHPSDPKNEGFEIHPLIKESFDKESIILESTAPDAPRIHIDPIKLNAIPKGELSTELRNIIEQENQVNNKPQPVVEATQSYVSSSPGFVPNQNNNFNRNNQRNNQRKNMKKNKKKENEN